ncbi:glutathione synthetase [Photobacterium sp. J15]|uniref:glutathione synthetase n=1 Tax=Photobacterium sp. J15 TaxID=265901 RepID=UPI000A897309|nr:glutathione synthetase [Photobacterium sp. J15]
MVDKNEKLNGEDSAQQNMANEDVQSLPSADQIDTSTTITLTEKKEGKQRNSIRIGFFVNDIKTEESGYTTTRLSMYAHNRGHEVFYITPEDFAYDPDEQIRIHTITPPKRKFKSLEGYIRDVQSYKSGKERIALGDLDILMLRNDPSSEPGSRAWAQQAGVLFSRMALQSGVVVVNDPNGLSAAMNKMYFQQFPEEVRPQTLISRNRDDIRHFANEFGNIVIKPLQGSGGKNVFMVRKQDLPNLNQMIDAVIRDGYVIAQEYLSEAEKGDIRLFLMNGQPLRYRGKYAAFRRVRTGDDMRSNIHAGGKKARAVIGEAELRIAEIVRPKLVQDGMFLVGLDIVGNKLMEINVFSPGGLGSAQSFEKVNFCTPVLDALERKVRYMEFYQRKFNNAEMAVL